MITVNLNQGSVEWHTFRKSHIGGSEIASIVGVNPWRSAYDLWLEKTDKKKPPAMNERMARGSQLEEPARNKYMKISKNIVMPNVKTYDKWDVASASLDGITEDGKTIVEIKCPGQKVYNEALEGKVPPYYMAQIQWQLMVSGASECDYFVYMNEDIQAQITILPDKEQQQEMLEAAKEFWEFVLNDVAPPLEGEDFLLIEDEELKKLLSEYKEENEKEKDAKNNKKLLKDKIVSFGDDGNFMAYGFKVKRYFSPVTYDIKKMKEAGIKISEYAKQKSEIGFYKITLPKKTIC